MPRTRKKSHCHGKVGKNHKKYHCELCPFKTNYKVALNEHVKAVHLKIKDFECEQCAFKTSYGAVWRRHIRKVHGLQIHKSTHAKSPASAEKKHSITNAATPKEKNNPGKKRSGAGDRYERRYSWKWKGKTDLFSDNQKRKSCLKRHLCGLCPKSMATRECLYQHLEDAHNIEARPKSNRVPKDDQSSVKRHLCGLCPKSMATALGLCKHLEEAHSIEIRTSFEFDSSDADSVVEVSNSGDDIDIDSIIMMNSDEEDAGNNNSKGEETTNFKCGICSRYYDDQEALFKHMSEDC